MNSRFAFVGFLIPVFTPYCWLLIPVVANFFVGYLVKEVDTAIKIIIACLGLNTGIVFGGLCVSTGYDTFLSIPLLASSPSSAVELSWLWYRSS